MLAKNPSVGPKPMIRLQPAQEKPITPCPLSAPDKNRRLGRVARPPRAPHAMRKSPVGINIFLFSPLHCPLLGRLLGGNNLKRHVRANQPPSSPSLGHFPPVGCEGWIGFRPPPSPYWLEESLALRDTGSLLMIQGKLDTEGGQKYLAGWGRRVASLRRNGDLDEWRRGEESKAERGRKSERG